MSAPEHGPETDGRRCSCLDFYLDFYRIYHPDQLKPWPHCQHEWAEWRARSGRLQAVRDRLIVRDTDDPAVRAALARLPRAAHVPHYALDDQSMATLESGARHGAIRPLPFPAWEDEDRDAYEAAFERCLIAARHDPEEIVAAYRAHLEGRAAVELDEPLRPDFSPGVWSAVVWAWERAAEEAEGRYVATLPPRFRELRTMLLRFRFVTERMRRAARRAGQTRAEFRGALARLTSLETRGRLPGRTASPILLAGFIDELSQLPILQQPILNPAEVSALVEVHRLHRLVDDIARVVIPLVESWRRFTPPYIRLVPEDFSDEDDAFPALDRDMALVVADSLQVEERRLSRPAPVRLAETLAAEMFRMSVNRAKEQVTSQQAARCTLARRAWRTSPTD